MNYENTIKQYMINECTKIMESIYEKNKQKSKTGAFSSMNPKIFTNGNPKTTWTLKGGRWLDDCSSKKKGEFRMFTEKKCPRGL